ncbi:hypothetical protein LguiA_035893 [Lonicera macranthoides]
MEGTSVGASIPEVARNEAGPSHQPEIVRRDLSFERSLQQRILILENAQSPVLIEKERGLSWHKIKTDLEGASDQGEYNRLLQFENRDLQIREQKHACYSLFHQILSENPTLAEKAGYRYKPDDVFLDFFDENRAGLDKDSGWWNVAKRDADELQFLCKVRRDLRERGPGSSYIKKILGLE